MFRSPYSQERTGYDTAQICLNGHVITRGAYEMPYHQEKHCSKCGAETLMACPACSEKIRGYLLGVVAFSNEPAPSFCHNCGKPYPWTERALQAARELALETDSLTSDEKQTLTKSLDDLVRDTPQTQVAIVRFKKLAQKAGSTVADGLKSVLVSVITEAAKKQIWP